MGLGPLQRSLLVLGAVVAGACGGGGDSASPTTVTAISTTTTTGGVSTTAAGPITTVPRISVPPADPGSVAQAEKGLLTVGDFGGPWVEFRPGAGALRDIGPTTRLGCSLQPTGSLDPSTIAAVVDGGIVQRGTTKRYATSSTLAFADEARAVAAANVFRSPAFVNCRTAAKTREAKESTGGAVDPQWRADPIDDKDRGQGGFEGILRFQFQAMVDGTLVDANGYESVLLYRIGRTVLVVAAEGLADPADPPNIDTAVTDDMNAAIVKAVNRLQS